MRQNFEKTGDVREGWEKKEETNTCNIMMITSLHTQTG